MRNLIHFGLLTVFICTSACRSRDTDSDTAAVSKATHQEKETWDRGEFKSLIGIEITEVVAWNRDDIRLVSGGEKIRVACDKDEIPVTEPGDVNAFPKDKVFDVEAWGGSQYIVLEERLQDAYKVTEKVGSGFFYWLGVKEGILQTTTYPEKRKKLIYSFDVGQAARFKEMQNLLKAGYYISKYRAFSGTGWREVYHCEPSRNALWSTWINSVTLVKSNNHKDVKTFILMEKAPVGTVLKSEK